VECQGTAPVSTLLTIEEKKADQRNLVLLVLFFFPQRVTSGLFFNFFNFFNSTQGPTRSGFALPLLMCKKIWCGKKSGWQNVWVVKCLGGKKSGVAKSLGGKMSGWQNVCFL